MLEGLNLERTSWETELQELKLKINQIEETKYDI